MSTAVASQRPTYTALIHGARSALLHARKQQPDRLREWANKLARIVWAVWRHERPLTQELQDAKCMTVKQVGPAPEQPTTIVAFEARCKRLADRRADSVMARGPRGSQHRGQIRLQSAPFRLEHNNNGPLNEN